jgi:hypothetical protein
MSSLAAGSSLGMDAAAPGEEDIPRDVDVVESRPLAPPPARAPRVVAPTTSPRRDAGDARDATIASVAADADVDATAATRPRAARQTARAAMAPAKEKSPPLVRRTGRKDARRPRVRPLPRVDDARARVDEDTRGSERSRAARARRYDRHARAVDATRG